MGASNRWRGGAPNRWRGRAARGGRGSARRVSTRGDWPSSDVGPGVRVDGMDRAAGAASQSAKPRSWRRPSPPPQPTQPVPVQTAEQAPLEGPCLGALSCAATVMGGKRGKRARGGWLRTRKMGHGRCLTREMSSIGGFSSARVRGSCDGADGREAIRTCVPGDAALRGAAHAFTLGFAGSRTAPG